VNNSSLVKSGSSQATAVRFDLTFHKYGDKIYAIISEARTVRNSSNNDRISGRKRKVMDLQKEPEFMDEALSF